MKLFAILGLVFVGLVRVAGADDVRILPYCAAKGPVYLEVHSGHLDGYIGMDKVHLDHDLRDVFGFINAVPVHLVLYADKTIRGRVGEVMVAWRLNERNDVVYGIQYCPPLFTNAKATE